MRAAIIAGFAALIATTTSTKAALIYSRDIGTWILSAHTSNSSGAFSHCAASARYTNGNILGFSIGKSLRWRMGLGNEKWKLTKGAFYPVRYRIDQGATIKAKAAVLNAKKVSVELTDSDALFRAFQTGHALTVDAAGQRLTFDLKGSSNALAAALRCARSLYSTNRNPVITGTTPKQGTSVAEVDTALNGEAGTFAEFPPHFPRPPDEQVARAQAYLLALGYNPGRIDGYYRVRTKAAIESFQRDNNLSVDGAVTAQLVAALAALHKEGTEPSRAEGDDVDLPPWRELAGFAPSAQLTEKLDPSDIFERVEGAIWKVVTLKGRTEHQGSAVAVTKDNLITNCHILTGGGRISIIRQDREMPVKLIAGDKESDRCVVQASQPLDSYVRGVRPSAGLKIGERVYAVGSPRGLELTMSEGIISGLRIIRKSRYIQTTAPISHGSSGGGLFDEGGNLIGITTFAIKKSQSLNFALAADEYWK